MIRHPQREQPQVNSATTQLGLAWYSREDWGRLHEIADDRNKLDDTYEAWERQALKMIRDLEAHGGELEPDARAQSPVGGERAWPPAHHDAIRVRGLDGRPPDGHRV